MNIATTADYTIRATGRLLAAIHAVEFYGFDLAQLTEVLARSIGGQVYEAFRDGVEPSAVVLKGTLLRTRFKAESVKLGIAVRDEGESLVVEVDFV
jgi:hypothetical protein